MAKMRGRNGQFISFDSGQIGYLDTGLLMSTIKTRIMNEMSEHLDDINDAIMTRLGTVFEKDNSHGGITPYDYFRDKLYKPTDKNYNKPRLYQSWKQETRRGAKGITTYFRNYAPHAPYLLTNTPSTGHPDGFRSALPHVPVVSYRDKIELGKRPEQLTKGRWDGLKTWIRNVLAEPWRHEQAYWLEDQ